MSLDPVVDIVRDRRIPLVQYWHEKTPPNDVRALLRSFKEHNPGLSHRVFNEATAEALIEDHFGPRHLSAFRACAVPAMQADYFRYCAVMALGGIYCDADERCVADLRPLLPEGDGAVLFELPEFGLIANGLFAFGRPGHPFLGLVLDIATTNIEQRLMENVIHVTGPLIFTWIHWAAKLGSFEAAIEYAERRVESLKQAGRLDTSNWRAGRDGGIWRSYRDAIGDYDRVAEVLDGVQVRTFAERTRFVRRPETQPRYKDSRTHYQHWAAGERSIFR